MPIQTIVDNITVFKNMYVVILPIDLESIHVQYLKKNVIYL